MPRRSAKANSQPHQRRSASPKTANDKPRRSSKSPAKSRNGSRSKPRATSILLPDIATSLEEDLQQRRRLLLQNQEQRHQERHDEQFIQKLTKLRDEAMRAAVGADIRQAIDQHYHDLQTAVEDLHIMREELTIQNEELSHTYELLNEERQRYRELFDFAPDAYLVTDGAGKISDANHYASALLNLDVRMFERKPLSTFIHRDSREQFWMDISSLTVGRASRVFRWRMAPRRKEPFEGEATAAVVRDGSEHVALVRWLIRDVTQMVRASDQVLDYQRRLRALTTELSRTEERERRQIAVEIHDRISQNLAMAKMRFATIQSRLSPDTKARLEADFFDALFLLEQTLEDTRTLTFELSPPILYELGLIAALAWLAEQLSRRHGIKVVIDGSQSAADGIGEDLRSLLFRSVRELLINTIKHAQASAARVSIRSFDRVLRVTVADDGRGFNPAEHTSPRSSDGRDGHDGFGLFSMRTRLEEIGGKVEIYSVPDTGTRVTLFAPINPSNSGGGSAHGHENSTG